MLHVAQYKVEFSGTVLRSICLLVSAPDSAMNILVSIVTGVSLTALQEVRSDIVVGLSHT